MRSRVALVALALLCTGQSYNVPFHPRAAPAGGGPTVAFDDSFTSDITGWTGVGSTCVWNAAGGGEMRQGTAAGTCQYDGAQTEGSQVGHRDSWMILEWGTSYDNFEGPILRHKGSDAGSTEYHYTVRHNSGATASRFRICDGDSGDADCSDIHAFSNTFSVGSGAMIALAVAGETTATQLCAWIWDSGEAPSQANMDDPTAWGDAHNCISTDGVIDNAKLTPLIDCAGTTTCETWDSAPSAVKGYPAAGQTAAQTYQGSASSAYWSRAVAGEL